EEACTSLSRSGRGPQTELRHARVQVDQAVDWIRGGLDGGTEHLSWLSSESENLLACIERMRMREPELSLLAALCLDPLGERIDPGVRAELLGSVLGSCGSATLHLVARRLVSGGPTSDAVRGVILDEEGFDEIVVLASDWLEHESVRPPWRDRLVLLLVDWAARSGKRERARAWLAQVGDSSLLNSGRESLEVLDTEEVEGGALLRWIRRSVERLGLGSPGASDPAQHEVSLAKELIAYLRDQVGSVEEARYVQEEARSFGKLPRGEVLEHLTGSYLLLEEYLVDVAPRSGTKREDLRALVAKRYAELLELDGFALLFEDPARQEILLCQRYLQGVVERSVVLLGVGAKRLAYLQSWLEWVPDEAGQPLPLDLKGSLPRTESAWVELLARLTRELSQELGNLLGQTPADRIFDREYAELEAMYRRLPTFPVLVGLLPERLLDREKVNLLGQGQVQRVLAQRAREVEELQRRLQSRDDFIRATFGRHLSDEKLAGLMEAPQGRLFSSEYRPVALLRVDLVGDVVARDPEDGPGALNGVFGVASDLVELHGGMVEGFWGETMLAIFGSAPGGRSHGEQALDCARDLHGAQRVLADWHTVRGLPEVKFRLVLHVGHARLTPVGVGVYARPGLVGADVAAIRALPATLEAECLASTTLLQSLDLPISGDPVFQENRTVFHLVPPPPSEEETTLVALQPAPMVRFRVAEEPSGSESHRGRMLSLSSRRATIHSETVVKRSDVIHLRFTRQSVPERSHVLGAGMRGVVLEWDRSESSFTVGFVYLSAGARRWIAGQQELGEN
ncbi:MAG: hypothetical protein QGG40_05395, partial [Myxococcota bacterium]|nr:hypothetical protein [Myxococcota bacterium]